MKRLSLRLRITILTSLCILIICVLLSGTMVFLAGTELVSYMHSGVIELEAFTILGDSGLTAASEPEVYLGLASDGLRQFQGISVWIMLFMIVLGTILAWWIAGIALIPMKKLMKQVECIDANHLSNHVYADTSGDELERLADVFNGMLDRLNHGFQREKRFSAAAAHELKTPLAVMQSSIDVLELSPNPTPEQYAVALGYIKRQLTRLTGLVEDLLAFSRYAQKSMVCRVQADDVLYHLLTELKEKYPNISLHENIKPVIITCNPSAIERAMFNLLDNAAKFTSTGGNVHISLFDKKEQMILSVSDDGPGIGDDAAKHIFEPFFREDGLQNRIITGTGLGLAFVHEFAQAYGGSIHFTNLQPNGCCFVLQIPQK